MHEDRKLFKRIVQAEADLSHARECAEQILDRKLHSATVHADKRLLRCLNTALIVSYWTPFSGNRGSEDVRKHLPSEYLQVLSDEQRRVHEQVGRARKKDQAHSDSDSRSVKVTVANVGNDPLAIPVSRDAHAPLSKDMVEELALMIKLLRAKLSEEHVRLQKKMTPGESF